MYDSFPILSRCHRDWGLERMIKQQLWNRRHYVVKVQRKKKQFNNAPIGSPGNDQVNNRTVSLNDDNDNMDKVSISYIYLNLRFDLSNI
jgi:hypothetical protein